MLVMFRITERFISQNISINLVQFAKTFYGK